MTIRLRYLDTVLAVVSMLLAPLSCYAEESAKPAINQPEQQSTIARPVQFPAKDTHEASLIRGGLVFKHYCVLCHGVNADGKGRAAKNYNPKPANLQLSDKNTMYKTMIITRGGAAMGRSQFMPPWGQELTKEQITDVVTYINSIAVNPPKD